jgi:hypothetical protein
MTIPRGRLYGSVPAEGIPGTSSEKPSYLLDDIVARKLSGLLAATRTRSTLPARMGYSPPQRSRSRGRGGAHDDSKHDSRGRDLGIGAHGIPPSDTGRTDVRGDRSSRQGGSAP